MFAATHMKEDTVEISDFLILIVSNFLVMISMSGLLTMISLYSYTLEGSEAAAGIATGIFTFSAVLFRMVMGKYFDKYKKKTFILCGCALFAVTSFLYGWGNSILFIYFLRFVQAIGWASLSTALFISVVLLVPKSRMNQYMGYFSASGPIGMALGPAFGSILIFKFSYVTAFNAMGILAVIAMAVASFLKDPDTNQRGKVSPSTSLFSHSALFASLLVFLVAMVIGVVITYIPILGIERGISNFGLFFSIYGIVSVLIRVFGGKLADKYGYFSILSPSLIIFAVATTLIAFANNFFCLMQAALLFGLGTSLTFPILVSLCVETSPEEEKGRAMATFSSSLDLGIGLGAIIMGFILTVTNLKITFLICTAITVITFIIVVKSKKRLVTQSRA